MSTQLRSKPDLPERIVKPQHEASDPDASAWASANAGSGKTHVLTQRVIRLLLRGEDPAKILCITFTKAAAANMATRVFDTLAQWTSLDDAALDREILGIGMVPGEALRTRARRLFALALETPGGLKVQTIHAFCTSLLHEFPFEAEVGAGFEVLDDVTQAQLLDRITLEVMLEGAAQPESEIGRALAAAIRAAANQTFRDLIAEAVHERDRIEPWVARCGSVEAAIAELTATLGIDANASSEAIARDIIDGGIDTREWPEIAAVLATGRPTDKEKAGLLMLAARTSGAAQVDCYLSIFCNDSKDESLVRRALSKTGVMTKGLRQANPEIAQRLDDEKTRIGDLLDSLRAVECRDRTHALLAIAHEVIVRYRREKARRSLLDYDDLIDRTLALFNRTSAEWVLYKLDLGINHLLVDEAQDTSPKQWDIISTLVSEFTAGAGARGIKRTLFVVGDDKQSIFSFQGAAPEKFGEMKKDFESDFTAAKLAWRNVKLQASFRSGEIVLQAVDTVFARASSYEALSSEKAPTVHESLPGKPPGHVDIWPLVKPEKKREPEGWEAPFDTTSETSPPVVLANKIAAHVKLWQTAGTRPGDVLILVRQRGPLFEAIIRALKAANIRVAGADRMVLLDHIAVMDLIALADALLLPDDDLALACVLKSPLFGLSDEDLFRIAHGRGYQSLRAALFGKAGEFPEATDRLKDLTDAALRDSPFTFYARLLGAGRGRILARLGAEASDALDEFLNLALEYERSETPSLQGFVAWLRAANAEVKRDMEMARDQVRVMTVHGAKGLEAHTVILADTTTRPQGYKPPALLDVPLPGGNGLVWAKSQDTDPPLVADARATARQAAIDEYKRLLYVGMTRAEQRLVVCGFASQLNKDGKPIIPEDCWYELVDNALVQDADSRTVEIPCEAGEGTIRRLCKYVLDSPQPIEQVISREEKALPAWIDAKVPADPVRAVAIRPSDSDDIEGKHGGLGAGREQALERGRLLHRLIQALPDIPPTQREAAAADYLRRNRQKLSQADCEALAEQALAILADARFAPLFAPGSRAEVPIAGMLPRDGLAPYSVTGQIDRLAVTETEILIGDYKTNRPAPATLDAAPRAYVRQLALYRALLQRIFPGRTVRAALIWTDNATLMELPQQVLDAELATLTIA